MSNLKVVVTFFSLLVFTHFTQQSPNQIRHLETTTYVTNPNRGITLKNQCRNTNRDKLYAEFGTDGSIPYGQSVANFFNWNMSVVDNVLDGNWEKFGETAKESGGKIFVYIGAWVIGLAVMVILFPFFLCCCLCPWSCPLWNRKLQKMPYTECQVKWPIVVSIILLLMIFFVSTIGIVSKFKATNSFQNVACASGVFLDDLINGNVSYYKNQIFFTGIRTLDTQLKQFNNKINDLNTQMAKLGSSSIEITNIKAKISTAKSSTAKIPNLSQSVLVLTYNSPIQSSAPTTALPSTFPTILGTKSSMPSSVETAYTLLTLYQSIIKVITDAADQYNSNFADYMVSISSTINSTSEISFQLQQQDKQLNNYFNQKQKIVDSLSIGEYVIYGALIILSILCGLAVVCTVWAKKDKCRLFMYLLCVLLFVLCLLTFLICIIASLLNPITYYTCQYFTHNLKQKAKLETTLSSRFGWKQTDVNKISDCIVKGGTGDIAVKLLSQDIFDSLTALQLTYANLSTVPPTYGQSISNVYLNLSTTINSYKQAKILDVTDSDAIAQLRKIAKPSEYACTSTGFTADSWVPSNNQSPVDVPCQVTSGKSTLATCSSLSAFSSRANGCVGCMDSFDLFSKNSTAADVLSALEARYSSPSCTIFNNQLSNIWNNFYKKKIDVITPVQTRFAQAKIDSDNVVSTLSLFSQVQTNINKDFSSIVNSQYGLVKGLNCKMIGEDIRMFRDVFCQSAFEYTYYIRVIFGIISLALSFTVCCLTCVGHRQFKARDFKKQRYIKRQNDSGQNNALSQERLTEMKKINHQKSNNYQNYAYFNNGPMIQ